MIIFRRIAMADHGRTQLHIGRGLLRVRLDGLAITGAGVLSGPAECIDDSKYNTTVTVALHACSHWGTTGCTRLRKPDLISRIVAACAAAFTDNYSFGSVTVLGQHSRSLC